MSRSGWLACIPVGIVLFVAACGGSAADTLSAEEQAEATSWPPLSLGGREPPRGPLEDPAINPATGRPYDDIPYCAEPARVLKAGERIELNEGAYVRAGSFAPWGGSYICTLTNDAASALLQVAVAMLDEGQFTCPGRGGGLVSVAAAVSMRLTDADGNTLHAGPCNALARVSAWPGRTNLEVDCTEVSLELRTGWFLVERDRSSAPETNGYRAECQRAAGG